MKYIQKKGNESYQLNKSHQMPPTTKEEARLRWKRFKHKAEVTDLLCAEQYGLCAYSEIRPDWYELGTHIEHVEPKSLNPQRTFDYLNLVLSALSDKDLQKVKKDVFGGHAKQKKYDATLFVSCLQTNCADFFAYLSNGQVEASRKLTSTDKEKAQYTIETLSLNSPYLINQRKKWLDELDAYIDEHIDNNWSLDALASIYLEPCSGKCYPFFTATCQRFGKYAKNYLF